MALIVFIVASITDAYDGYYARKYNEITSEGLKTISQLLAEQHVEGCDDTCYIHFNITSLSLNGNKIDNIIDIFNHREIIGEITIVIKGLEKSNQKEVNHSKLKKEVEELVNAGLSLSAASRYLAKKNNLKKNMIYNLF